jgi:hypothetical protein
MTQKVNIYQKLSKKKYFSEYSAGFFKITANCIFIYFFWGGMFRWTKLHVLLLAFINLPINMR